MSSEKRQIPQQELVERAIVWHCSSYQALVPDSRFYLDQTLDASSTKFAGMLPSANLANTNFGKVSKSHASQLLNEDESVIWQIPRMPTCLDGQVIPAEQFSLKKPLMDGGYEVELDQRNVHITSLAVKPHFDRVIIQNLLMSLHDRFPNRKDFLSVAMQAGGIIEGYKPNLIVSAGGIVFQNRINEMLLAFQGLEHLILNDFEGGVNYVSWSLGGGEKADELLPNKHPNYNDHPGIGSFPESRIAGHGPEHMVFSVKYPPISISTSGKEVLFLVEIGLRSTKLPLDETIKEVTLLLEEGRLDLAALDEFFYPYFTIKCTY